MFARIFFAGVAENYSSFIHSIPSCYLVCEFPCVPTDLLADHLLVRRL